MQTLLKTITVAAILLTPLAVRAETAPFDAGPGTLPATLYGALSGTLSATLHDTFHSCSQKSHLGAVKMTGEMPGMMNNATCSSGSCRRLARATGGYFTYTAYKYGSNKADYGTTPLPVLSPAAHGDGLATDFSNNFANDFSNDFADNFNADLNNNLNDKKAADDSFILAPLYSHSGEIMEAMVDAAYDEALAAEHFNEDTTEGLTPDALSNAISYETPSYENEESEKAPDDAFILAPLYSHSGELKETMGDNWDEPPFDVPVVMNERVEWYLRAYQTRGKKYFTRWLEKSGAYLPHLKRILREKGMPEDLAYLALIESGFNPYLISRARAVGVWQFMRPTARIYDLRVDWWVDERRDFTKSTYAAAEFLDYLYKRFDSWQLAWVAYNAGPGKVSYAIRKNKTRDLWELVKKRRPLVRETKDYVPKYYAAMMIAKDPAKYGFHDLNYHDPIAFDTVPVDRPTDIKVIAVAAGTTVKEIKKLNPELRRWFTPPGRGDYEVKIPKGTAEAFSANMALVPKGDRLRFHHHKIKPGETLSQIARRYGTSVAPIMYLNDIKRARFIRAGKKIVVPVREGTKMTAKARTKKKARPAPPGTRPYKVKEGDTLWDISMKFGVDVKTLKKWNGIGRRSIIRPGETLHVKNARLTKLIETVKEEL